MGRCVGGSYLDLCGPLLDGMRRDLEQRRAWATLGEAEKQRRLTRLRLAQQQQVARDARALLLVRAG